MRLHQDDRRLMYADIFPDDPGDINVTVLEPGALCAWHKHNYQHDKFLVLQGTVKFGIIDAQHDDVVFTTVSERHPMVIPVEEGLWHGYQNIGPGQAIILMRLSNKYDPNDEKRLTVADAEERYGAYWTRDAR